MNSIGRRLAGVGLGALFVVGLAYAQTTDDSTTTTTGPAATAPASPSQDPNCPHDGLRGGRGSGAGGSGGSVSPTPAPSSSADPGSV